MKGSGIKVGSIRPDQRVDFLVKPDLIKELEVSQWTIEISRENGLEVNDLMGVIFKLHANGIGPHD